MISGCDNALRQNKISHLIVVEGSRPPTEHQMGLSPNLNVEPNVQPLFLSGLSSWEPFIPLPVDDVKLIFLFNGTDF